MELAGVPTDDRNAGYIDEDESDIEYSDFEEADWDANRYFTLCCNLFNAHHMYSFSVLMKKVDGSICMKGFLVFRAMKRTTLINVWTMS